ncbi:hypothetical protein JOC26_001808 [Sporohalobacter salinus]|nr:hypothetical protein [Sporohalobacter salinus]
MNVKKTAVLMMVLTTILVTSLGASAASTDDLGEVK